MEYADDGDVFQRICECQNNKQFMKEKHIWKIVIQVVKGLKSLHEMKILHRDMKSANIFLYKDTTAKLGDLNVSKVAKKGLLYTQTGTPYYASPEVWKDQPYDLKSDIWSLGCVIYEMCALVPPFRADDMNGLFKKVLKGQYPPIPSHYSMDMRQLIKTLLQVYPAARPTCDQILDMAIVQKRIKKYFNGRDGNSPVLDTQEAQTDSELLKTIKLSKNVFKLSLPASNYDQSHNFATIPGSQVPKTVGRMNRGEDSRNGKVSRLTTNPNPGESVGQSRTIPTKSSEEGALPRIKKSRLQTVDDDYEDDFEQEQRLRPKNHARREEKRGVVSDSPDGYAQGGDLNNENYTKGGSKGNARKASVNTNANTTSPSDNDTHTRSRSRAGRDSKAGVSKLRSGGPNANTSVTPPVQGLPQVSGRSKDENTGGAGSGSALVSNKPVRSRGLSQSPSVHSLH